MQKALLFAAGVNSNQRTVSNFGVLSRLLKLTLGNQHGKQHVSIRGL